MAELAQKKQRPAAEDYCLRRQKEAEIKALNKAMMEAMISRNASMLIL